MNSNEETESVELTGIELERVKALATMVDLAARLGVGEATVIRCLGSLVESGRAVSTHRTGDTFEPSRGTNLAIQERR